MFKSSPYIVQYQGSKRLLAPKILQYMPKKFNKLIEPFSGTAAISIAVAKENITNQFYINDLNKPLVCMLKEAIQNPTLLSKAYEELYFEQFEYFLGHIHHYYKVRDNFNEGNQSAEKMLYLLARCVKGAVRYNKKGQFNQSLDKRRHGTNPKKIAHNLNEVSKLLKNKCSFSSLDFREIINIAQSGDLVYLDPPYQGVSNSKNQRYQSGILFDDLVDSIKSLEKRNIDFIISYDGKCGNKEYGKDLTHYFNGKKILLNAGLSTQALLLGKKSTTFEALYLSKNLIS